MTTYLHDKVQTEAMKPLGKIRDYFRDPETNLSEDKVDVVARTYKTQMLDLSMELASAERLVLDEKALRTVIWIASGAPFDGEMWAMTTKPMLEAARLPFNSMWIEYDANLRNEVQAALGTLREPLDPDQQGTTAFLLRRNRPDDPTLYTIEWIGGDKGPQPVSFSGCSYGLSTETPGLPHRMNGLNRVSLSSDDLHAYPWGLTEPNGKQVVPPDIGTGYAQVMECRWSVEVCAAMGLPKEAYDGMAEKSAREGRGDLRFIIALLALMNCVPTGRKVRQTSGRKYVSGKFVTYMHNATVTIDLDRKETVSLLDERLKEAERARKRAHMVRGHWRRVREPDGGVRRVWIKEHQRGDAGLGWVNHSYVVTAKQGAERQ